MSTIGTLVRQEGETTDTARRPKHLLAAIALSYDLAEESEALIAEARTVSDGRAAKTLSKHPGLNNRDHRVAPGSALLRRLPGSPR